MPLGKKLRSFVDSNLFIYMVVVTLMMAFVSGAGMALYTGNWVWLIIAIIAFTILYAG